MPALPPPSTAPPSPPSPALSPFRLEREPRGPPSLPLPHGTNHQDVNGGGGLQPAQPQTELVATRVRTLRLSDEEDGVPLPVPHTHTAGVQGTAITRPDGLRFGFALRNREMTVSGPQRPLAPPSCSKGQIHQLQMVT